MTHGMVRILNYYKDDPPFGYEVVDTTSRSPNWSRGLSPFLTGPCPLYDGHVAENVENGWQFSKVYPEHVDAKGNPTPAYFDWARKGWRDRRAHRYPAGKGRKPLYSWWSGDKLTYLEARKHIYIPLYARAVSQTGAFQTLLEMVKDGVDVALRDFDGYDHVKLGRSLKDVLNDPARKMGHAFILAMILEHFTKDRA